MQVYKTSCKAEKSQWYNLCVKNGAVYIYYGKNNSVYRGAALKNNLNNNYFFSGGELAAYAEELIPLQNDKMLLRKRDYIYII